MNRYDLLESVSQGKDGTMPEENYLLAQVANDIRRATERSGDDEKKSLPGNQYAMILNEREKRAAEGWAKERGAWIGLDEIFSLGVPGPSGSESDTYLSTDGFIYKTNNLMHCGDSIVKTISKFLLYNIIFPDSAYSFVGFTGFVGRSVYPIVKQPFIKNSVPATRIEIDYFMAALGFDSLGNGRYANRKYMLKDILPKNVLKDEAGDFFAIDAEIDVLYL